MILLGASWALTAHAEPAFRVCSDPNNLPFSNARGEGFENKLAELFARALHRKLEYAYWPERRGFIRNTLRANRCDVVIGVPRDLGMLETTTPYYTSSYTFVTRANEFPGLSSFDDPRLRALRIGVHVIGDDYSNVPPAQALAARGIVEGVHGYPIYGDYTQPDPPRALIDAVKEREIDVAIVWGPIAGFFARETGLRVTRVAEATPEPGMVFAISLGVRRGEHARKAELERVLSEHRQQIHALLARYGVPLVEPGPKR